MDISNYDIVMAFKNGHDQFLKKIHLKLNNAYFDMIFNQEESNILNDESFRKLKYIENIWIENEKSECLNRYDCYKKINTIQDVQWVLMDHAVYMHPLFHYLTNQAILPDLKYYILNDSVLNLEFFDYLAYAIIGVSDEAKSEIISNLWDEAGAGCISKFHTSKFRDLLNSLGLKYKRKNIIENMSWEGLAGINLFSYFAFYPYNKMKYFGLLAATEMLDPPHYHQLIKSILKISQEANVDYSYYTEHEEIDVHHSRGWLLNVILPELKKNPSKICDFWMGFYMRLDSVHRYYDKLLAYLKNKKAA